MNISEVKTEDLQNASQFSAYQQAPVNAVETGKSQDALEFRRKIQEFFRIYSDIEATDPELFRNYRKLVLYIELEYFEVLPTDLQVALLQSHFSSFALLKIDVAEKVSLALAFIDPAIEDEYKEIFLAGLLNNQERIGSERIELQGKMVRPTIANWVSKYRLAFGNTKQDTLVQIDYTTRDEARMLSEADKTKLQKVLEVVEILKTTENEEEDIVEEGQMAQPTPTKREFSPLFVPAKKAKASLPEVTRVAKVPQIQRNTVAQQPVQDEATPQTGSAPAFRSLADLQHLDLAAIHSMGVPMSDFVFTIKNEISKVYTRSPQSKPHIVALWRQSPIYRLYVEMGENSMKTKLPIEEVSRMRASQNLPTLTKEEFDTIADLSRTIQ